MITIAHILNPVKVSPSSDLAVAQPVTFASLMAASQHLDPTVAQVELLSAQFPEDRDFVPTGFRKTRDLERSILDFGTFKVDRKLPLLHDIIDRMYQGSDAEWLVYTNVDIAVQPHFYEAIASIIDDGFDAFAINRRTISNRYSSPDQLAEMYADPGVPHPGYDCFVFRRTLWPKVDVGNIVLGMPKLGKAMLINLAVHANKFAFFPDLKLTFHIGDDRNRQDPDLEDMREFNLRVFTEVWERLRPLNPDLEALRPAEAHPVSASWKSLGKAGRDVLKSVIPESTLKSARSAFRQVVRPKSSFVKRYANKGRLGESTDP